METNDIVTKEFEAYPDVAADILNALLHEGKKVVREGNLLPAPTETLYRGSRGSRSQLEDLAKYEFIDKELTMVYLFANQTAICVSWWIIWQRVTAIVQTGKWFTKRR